MRPHFDPRTPRFAPCRRCGRGAMPAVVLLLALVALVALVAPGAPPAAAAPVAARATGVLVVLDRSANALLVVDPFSLRVRGRVPVGESPHEVAVTPDGRLAFVANYGNREPGTTISVVDLGRMQERARIPLFDFQRPHGIAVRGDKVYFTSERKRAVGRIDVHTLSMDWSAPTRQEVTHMLAIAPDGGRLWTTNLGSNTVSVIDLPAGTSRRIAVGPQPEAIDVAPDGREVWVGQDGDGGISILDARADTVLARMAVGRVPIRIKFTPDGRRVLVSDAAAGELVIIDARARQVIRRIAVGAIPIGIAIEPSGRRAFVAVTRDNRVQIVDLESLRLAGSFEPGQAPGGLAWAGGAAAR